MAKENSGFKKAREVSPELAAVVGAGPMPMTEAVSKIWAYIHKHNLQNPKNKRNILADEPLKKLFGGKAEVTMFEMMKIVNSHLSK